LHKQRVLPIWADNVRRYFNMLQWRMQPKHMLRSRHHGVWHDHPHMLQRWHSVHQPSLRTARICGVWPAWYSSWLLPGWFELHRAVEQCVLPATCNSVHGRCGRHNQRRFGRSCRCRWRAGIISVLLGAVQPHQWPVLRSTHAAVRHPLLWARPVLHGRQQQHLLPHG
jgi:hypothetical protein